MENHMFSVDNLSQVVVFDEHAEKTVLADLWGQQPAVMVFVRHFG